MSKQIYVSEALLDIKISALYNLKDACGLTLPDAENLCIYMQLKDERVKLRAAILEIHKIQEGKK